MIILATLITIFAILGIIFGRNKFYTDSDGVQQGDGIFLSVLWITIVYVFIWFLFLDKLPDWLRDLGLLPSIGLFGLAIVLWISGPDQNQK